MSTSHEVRDGNDDEPGASPLAPDLESVEGYNGWKTESATYRPYMYVYIDTYRTACRAMDWSVSAELKQAIRSESWWTWPTSASPMSPRSTVPSNMEYHLSTVALGVALLCVQMLSSTSGHSVPFDYNDCGDEGPSSWGNVSGWEACGVGQEQSPISMNISDPSPNESLGALNMTYDTGGDVILVNTGHALQVTFNSGGGSFIIGNETYTLRNFHFHAPSEHFLNNVRFPLEMHLVHNNSLGEIAVIGVVFWQGCHNQFLDQIWEKLEYLKEKHSQYGIEDVSLEHLHLGPSYARYMGSLTTPPCTENVTWTVELSQWNTVSESQIAALADVFPEPNARPLQEVNGREVDFYQYELLSPYGIYS